MNPNEIHATANLYLQAAPFVPPKDITGIFYTEGRLSFQLSTDWVGTQIALDTTLKIVKVSLLCEAAAHGYSLLGYQAVLVPISDSLTNETSAYVTLNVRGFFRK